ncbi:hypothetical protein VH569_19485 [Azospirillum sp. 11R-A]|uniref:hypothetical protein n=1 Tax=Azospirillum sp. 11R-A TaxID=3111634 RepID=UPI003C189E88
MNVAVATSTVSRPFAFMTPRGSDAVDPGAGTRTPTSSTVPQAEADTAGTTEPLVNRFPTVAFSYDTDASRLVMLYRDPANGKTVSQIPTEAALKQYKEAQQKEKDAERASLLKLTVGESGQAGGQAGGRSAAYVRGGTDGTATAGTATASTPRTAAPVTSTASAAAAFVAHSASVVTTPTGTSAGRVNVVI